MTRDVVLSAKPGDPGQDRCEAGSESCLVSRDESQAPVGRANDQHDHAHDGHAAASGHGHGHAHVHRHRRERDRRRLVVALALSATIFVAELIGGLASGSLALISDAGHVLADMSGLVISLLAFVLAARPPTARRTFGYFRLEILAALANGVVLLVLAALVAVAAVSRLPAPAPVKAEVMLPVAVVGLLANLAAMWLLHGAHTLNARSAYLHVLSDTLSSVAVIIGGVLIAVDARFAVLDPILGLAIAGIVVFGAFRLLREAVDVLLEAVPSGVDLEEVRSGVREVPGVRDVHDLHIWTITSGLVALSAHVVVEDGAACDQLLRTVKDFLRKQHRIGHSTIQIESTAYDRPD